jgi:hypothetical protein
MSSRKSSKIGEQDADAAGQFVDREGGHEPEDAGHDQLNAEQHRDDGPRRAGTTIPASSVMTPDAIIRPQ